jgi:hypothetical protein
VEDGEEALRNSEAEPARPHRRGEGARSLQIALIMAIGLGAIASIAAFFWLAQG